MNKTTGEFKISKVAISVAIALIVWVSTRIFPNILCFIIKNTLYYYNHFCKLLKITGSIVNKKVDKFKIFVVTITIAFIMVIYFHYIFINIFLYFICFIIETVLS